MLSVSGRDPGMARRMFDGDGASAEIGRNDAGDASDVGDIRMQVMSVMQAMLVMFICSNFWNRQA